VIVPPPWSLTGDGYVLVFSPFPRPRDPLGEGFDRPEVKRIGGFGILMILDYRRSEVGPYREVLYIPGCISAHVRVEKSDQKGGAPILRGHSISRIFVTSALSRDGGIANWGIPKLLGRIERDSTERGADIVRLFDEIGEPLLRAAIPRRGGALSAFGSHSAVPFGSRLLPRTLIQVTRTAVYTTTISAAGRIQPLSGARLTGFTEEMERIAARKIFAAFRIPKFTLQFPHAVVRSLTGLEEAT
jgi:hypothetical protein